MKLIFDLDFGRESSGFGLAFLQTTDRLSLYDEPSVVHKLHYAAPDFGSVSVAFVHDGPSAVKRRTIRRVAFQLRSVLRSSVAIVRRFSTDRPSLNDRPSVVLTSSQH